MKYFKLLFSLTVLLSFYQEIFAIQAYQENISCPSITKDSTIGGLPYAAFNCYSDNNWLDTSLGGDPHEQNFLRIRKNNESWKDSVSVSNTSDKINLFMFAHNSGAEGQYPAYNTNYNIDWSNPSKIIAKITSSNSAPSMVNDTTSLSLSNGVQLIPEALWYKNKKVKDISPTAKSITIRSTAQNSSYINAKWFFVTFRLSKDTVLPTCHSAQFTPNTINGNSDSILTVQQSNATSASYSCSGGLSGKSEELNLTNGKKFLNISSDSRCSVTVHNSLGSTVCSNAATLSVDNTNSPICDSAKFTPSIIDAGGMTRLTVQQTNATSAEYTCSNTSGGNIKSGSLNLQTGKRFIGIQDSYVCQITLKNENKSTSCNAILRVNGGDSPDLEIVKLSNPLPKSKGSGILNPDQVFTYSIAIKNTGAETLQNISIVDLLDSHISFVSNRGDDNISSSAQQVLIKIDSLPANKITVKHFDVQVKSNVTAGTKICNIASVQVDGKSKKSEKICHDIEIPNDPLIILNKTSSDSRHYISTGGLCGHSINTCAIGTVSGITSSQWTCIGSGKYATNSTCSGTSPPPPTGDVCRWDEPGDNDPETFDNNCYFQ